MIPKLLLWCCQYCCRAAKNCRRAAKTAVVPPKTAVVPPKTAVVPPKLPSCFEGARLQACR